MSAGQVFGPRYAIVPEEVLYAEVSPTAKLLWAVLQRHADPDGHCYPSKKRLQELLGNVSEDTVRRAKNDLAEAGLIEVSERYDDAGRRTSDDVHLLGALRKFAAPDPRKFAGVNKRQLKENHKNVTTGASPRSSAGVAGQPDDGPEAVVIWFECPNCRALPAVAHSCAVCAGTGRFRREA